MHSATRFSFLSHSLTVLAKLAMKREPAMACRLSMLSSSSTLISSLALSVWPRSSPFLMYLSTTKLVAAHLSWMALMSFSILDSCLASFTMSAMASAKRSSFMVKMAPSVKVLGFTTILMPESTEILSQWRSFIAGFLRLAMSGRLSRKPFTSSKTAL